VSLSSTVRQSIKNIRCGKMWKYTRKVVTLKWRQERVVSQLEEVGEGSVVYLCGPKKEGWLFLLDCLSVVDEGTVIL
jgi:hypothetical protein